MKLRILNNSVRLRLSKDDMDRLYSDKVITASCQLLNATLQYKIVLDSEQANITAALENQTILVIIPTIIYKNFYESSNEGIYNNTDQLKIAIERDFKCLTPRGEDESKLFSNPRESH